jgi:hypothetical protein
VAHHPVKHNAQNRRAGWLMGFSSLAHEQRHKFVRLPIMTE